MNGRAKKQILDEVVEMRGRQGKLGRRLRASRERNWLLALILNSYAKEAAGQELNDLDRVVTAAFDEAGLGDQLREHGAMFAAMPADVRKQLFPGRYATLSVDSDYTMDDVVADLPDLDAAIVSMPNASDLDVAGIHRGEKHLRDVQRPHRSVVQEYGGELIRAVEVDGPQDAFPPTDPYLIKATGFRCNDETGADFLGSDEVYWIFGSVGAGATVTSRSHIFEDIDSGDTATFGLNEGIIWGPAGVPQGLPEGEIGSLVQLWEHDNGDPDEVKAAVGAAFAVAGAVLLASGVAAWISAVTTGVGAAVAWLIGFLDDDHIADQTFVFTRQTIADQMQKGNHFFDLTRQFTDGGGDYTLTMRVTHVAPGTPEVRDRSGEFSAPAATGAPSAVYLPGLAVENITYRDGSGRLHEIWRDANGGTGTTDLTANAGAPAAAGNPFAYVDTARNTEILLFRGGDGTVRSLYWSTGAVGHDDLSGSAGSPRAFGDPVGYYIPSLDQHHVVYRTSDGHLHELNWTGIAPVQYGGNLTGAISAPRAAGDPSGYANAGGDNIVAYRATDGRILSVYWQHGPSGLDDLSGTAGTPTATSDPVAYYTPHNDTNQVFYVAGDGHVYELYWQGVAPVGGWDLSAAAGAPAASGKPTAFYNPANNTKHVVYRGNDQRLYDIRWVPGGPPSTVDLTSLAAAPLAADRPVGFATPGVFTQHVAYRGTDNHIYEIRWT